MKTIQRLFNLKSLFRKIILSGAFVLATMAALQTAYAQNGVLIAPTTGTADNSAMLEVRSSNKGLLVPNISLSDINDNTTIAGPANSLLVYNLTNGNGLTPGYYFNSGTSLNPVWVPLYTGGTVTSVGLSLPSIFSVSNSPVITSGTLTGTLISENANTVFAAPSAGNGTPTFRSLVAADIPSLATSYIQNQTVSAQTAGFNINGNGYVGGNVGIGTISPSGSLGVQSTTITSGKLVDFSTSGNTWTGNGVSSGLVNISSASTAGVASQDVLLMVSRSGTNTSGHSPIGIYSKVTNAVSNGGINRGMYIYVTGNTSTNYGIDAQIAGIAGAANAGLSSQVYTAGANNYGLNASATGAATANYGSYATASTIGTATNYGTYTTASSANGAATNYGLYSSASCTSNGTNYGIYGTASGGVTNWAGYFSGNVNITGTATAASFSGPLTGNVTGNVSGSSGSCTGNAATATALQTGHTISIGGDLAYTSPAFDGSANVTAQGILATVNSNIGTFNNITINAKGLATSGSNVAYLTANQNITLSGDITGSGATGINTTVTQINGSPLGTTTGATIGYALKWNGSSWAPAADAGLTSESDPIVRAINGIVKSNGTTISAAVAGADYVIPSGSITGSSASCTGNAATATKLATPRNINGVAFDGTADITIPAGVSGSGTAGQMAYFTGSNAIGSSSSNTWSSTNGTQSISTSVLSTTTPSLVLTGSTNNSTYANYESIQLYNLGYFAGAITGIGFYNSTITAPTSRIVSTLNSAGTGAKLDFYTLNGSSVSTDRMTIDQNGNVGIGTTGPSYNLDVAGDINFTGTLRLSGVYGGNGQVLTSNGSGGMSWTTPSGGVSGSGTASYLPKWSGSSALINSLVYDNGSYAGVGITSSFPAYFSSTGGIGVDGGNAFAGTFPNSSTTATGATSVIRFGAYTSGEGIGSNRVTAGGNLDGLSFFTGFSEKMTVANTGNVGIGNTNPGKTLDVLSKIGIYAGKNSDPTIKNIYSTASWFRIGSNGTTNSALALWGNANADVDDAPQMIILGTNGNVGIGTTTPSSLLSVGSSSQFQVNTTGNVTAASFVKSGGSSSQFLKADGSSDGTAYLSTAVTSLTGTANQITASASTGAVTLSLPSTINVNTSGNAATATKLQTARSINGVSFDGSADITITTALSGGTASYIPKWSSSSALTSSLMTDNGSAIYLNGRLNILENSSGYFEIMANGSYNGSDTYLGTGYAGRIEFGRVSGQGNWYFETAPSGSAGSTPTYSTKMTILNGGNVGIGTTTPSYTLDVNGQTRLGSAGTPVRTMQTGQFAIGASSSQKLSYTFSFTNTFTNAPKVFITQVATGGTYTDSYSVTIMSVSTTQCTISVYRNDGTSWGTGPTFNWLAIDNQ